MLKKTKLVSLILLAGAFALPEGAFAEIAPVKQEANISQQSGKITGVVQDALGPVAGASVVVKGTTNGSVTDMDGHFTLDGVKKGDIIQVSFIGYVTQEIKYTGQVALSVDLKEDSQALQEVVVVGYGTQKKANLTGAVTSVAGDVLESRPIANVGQGLQGIVPNLNITMDKGGAPGKGSNFNIRGTTSINGGSPLVLVDNVQMDANLVNPEDIASISILKDAASAAIYGARAAYGVILITTKNGKKDHKPQVSVSASGYWQSPSKRIHGLNSMEYLNMFDQASENIGQASRYSQKIHDYAKAYFNGEYAYPEFYDEGSDQNRWQYCGNTDWFDELYKKSSFSQMYNVNLNGGSEKTTYYASVGFNDVGGLLKEADDSYKKFNATMNISTDITKWLNVSAKIMNTYTSESHPSGGTTKMNSTAYSGIEAYSGMMKNDLSPLMPVYHGHTGRLYNTPGAGAIADGEGAGKDYKYYFTNGINSLGGKTYVDDGQRYFAGQGGNTNPIALQKQGGLNQYKTNDLWMTGAVKLTPLEGLVVNADFTFNSYNQNSKQHVERFAEYKAVAGTEGVYPWTDPSSVVLTNQEDYYTAFNAFAEYTKSFNDTHNFKVMAGYNQEYKHTKDFWAGRKGLIDDSNPALNLASGEKNVGYSESQWAINGFFARINYNYKQRYLLELNGRYDGSSKFPKDDRYAFFPSVSAAWRISEESFWEPIKGWWNDMKIRGSYGSLGNQVTGDLGNFPYLASYGTNTSYGMILGGSRPIAVTPAGLVSASFTWETVNQIDFGADASFLNNRLTGSFDWYRRNTKDMLTAGQALPAVLGTGVPVENAANLKTIGWELSLGWTDQLESGLRYWVKGVLADYQAEITKFPNPTGTMFLGDKGDGGDHNQYYPGYALGSIYGYRSDGLFQTDEEAAKANQSEFYAGKWAAGDVRYLDLNGDGKITRGKNTLGDMGDQTIIGNTTPRYSYGLTGGFEYKGFDFEMFWQGIGKRDYMCGGYAFWGFTSEWDVPLEQALDYWTVENTDAYFPRPTWQNGGNRKNSDRYLQNAAYIRLKNLTLGYTFPKQIMSKAGISRLRIYLQGENLLTFTPLIDSFDPETLNNMTYPISKKYSVGLNLTF